MSVHPWRTLTVTGAWTLLGHPRRGLESSGIDLFKRANVDEAETPQVKDVGAISSIAIGVLFCLFLVTLAGLGVYYLFKRRRQRAGDLESSEKATMDTKRNWFAVDGKDEKKGGLSDWWRQSHSIPDRVEPPPSARPAARTSLQRLKSALTRSGALKSHKRTGSSESKTGLIPKLSLPKATSPTETISLPMQTVPQTQPRYPSVLERGYRVPLYPVQPMPQSNSPPRSLTTPSPIPPPPPSTTLPSAPHPITVAERAMRKKLTPPPRALKITNGRPLVPMSERKTGTPRSPAHRRRGLGNQFKHPFLPINNSDTAFPTISAPMPSAETGSTNPKLSYSVNTHQAFASMPRAAPMAPGGPRHLARASTRRIPVPAFEFRPPRPLPPATPTLMREEVRVLPPGTPSVPRPAPTPI